MTDRERLIELLVNSNTHDSYECKLCTKKDVSCTRCSGEKLADYLLANGVIVPPCKVGDEIYYLFPQQGIQRAFVRRIQIGKYGVAICTKYGATLISEIGKTVFLTREEAEKALKERENNG